MHNNQLGNRTDDARSTSCRFCEALKAENARLRNLLVQHGITWEETLPPPGPELPFAAKSTHRQLTTEEKVSLFRRLFRGRQDVYAVRWESAKGKSGYSPACVNEWRAGICNKPKVKCSNCDHRLLLPVTDQVIYEHLAGHCTIGVYPLSADDTCCFLAVDLDDANWRDDSRAFLQSCRELHIPAGLEISRSGKGAHVWIFFAEPIPAVMARQLGAALISYTCDRTRQLSLSSYDRLFPNQDTLPKGGFGNLIALPLQKQSREQGCSVFADESLVPFQDQWAFLAEIRSLSRPELENFILQASGGRHPLDVAFVADDDEQRPWIQPAPLMSRVAGPLPDSLILVLANQLFIDKKDLNQPLTNRLIRLAAFQNPEFYKAQSMRLPVWNKPRVIGCAENFPKFIGLPRGCTGAALDLLDKNGIGVTIEDERVAGYKVAVKFSGTLRKEQKTAVTAMLEHDTGVLCAPTAFGKTITAAAMIARRKVSTLIMVHRTELLCQWQERLVTFLDLPKGMPGLIGGGKNKPTGKIDIAVMQSLSRRDELQTLLDNYGQVIVDECHHVSAFSFEAILKQAKARYILGLTATPIRRDGHHPIIFMQCGPIRHSAGRPDSVPSLQEVWPRSLPKPDLPQESKIQDVFRVLANDAQRNQCIVQDILAAYGEGRKIIVLTERTEHLELLHALLEPVIEDNFVLHGRLSKKMRAAILAQIAGLDDSRPRVILATGRLIGEGFDHPPLDTLVLAMPISWKGTLQQYAGRLHRAHADKKDVRIYDYLDDHPQLARMWDKRQRGYRSMGYRIRTPQCHAK